MLICDHDHVFSQFINCLVFFGGAIFLFHSEAIIQSANFAQNSAYLAGGAVMMQSSDGDICDGIKPFQANRSPRMPSRSKLLPYFGLKK
jgi:predicted outer membrane repeat protein